uniref:Uncharacterized protein n=1 Tax=viral metagenome TaxID=1070528 RepID=A0A6C0H8U4_9ZZZZ
MLKLLLTITDFNPTETDKVLRNLFQQLDDAERVQESFMFGVSLQKPPHYQGNPWLDDQECTADDDKYKIGKGLDCRLRVVGIEDMIKILRTITDLNPNEQEKQFLYLFAHLADAKREQESLMFAREQGKIYHKESLEQCRNGGVPVQTQHHQRGQDALQRNPWFVQECMTRGPQPSDVHDFNRPGSSNDPPRNPEDFQHDHRRRLLESRCVHGQRLCACNRGCINQVLSRPPFYRCI